MLEVWVTLTTIPSRLHQLDTTLLSICQQSIVPHVICVNIPKVFKRDGSEYTNLPNNIAQLIHKYNNIRFIINICIDIGPASKVLAYLQKDQYPAHAIVISIDDDIYYPKEMIASLLSYNNENMVYCGSGLRYVQGHLQNVYLAGAVEVIEGYCAVRYTGYMLNNMSTLHDKLLADCSKAFFTCDDITISNELAKQGIKCQMIAHYNFNKWLILQNHLACSEDINALQHGANGCAIAADNVDQRYQPVLQELINDNNIYLHDNASFNYAWVSLLIVLTLLVMLILINAKVMPNTA